MRTDRDSSLNSEGRGVGYYTPPPTPWIPYPQEGTCYQGYPTAQKDRPEIPYPAPLWTDRH